MSQSPLARTARRTLPAFSRTPSRLSHSTSRQDLSTLEAEDDSPSPSPVPLSKPSKSTSRRQSTPASPAVSRYKNSSTSTQDDDMEGDEPGPSTSKTLGPSTPHTPKILYSPYATSTPPSALSKSTSIPFDMAASLRAGRKAEEEARSRTPETEVSKEVKRKKRFVRKRPLYQRMMELPETIYDQVSLHFPTSVEAILPATHLANPTSLALNAVQWLLLAPLLSSHKEYDSILRSSPAPTGVGSRWDKYDDTSRTRGRGFGGAWATLLLTILLFALASANSVYLFTKFRTYDMQLRDANDPVPSPHASPISAPRSWTDVPESPEKKPKEESREAKIARMTIKGSVTLVKWSFFTILSIFGHHSQHASSAYSYNEDKIQSLRVWEPPEFSLAFFCAYPPSAPVLTYLLTPLHPLLTPMLHLITSFLLSHLATTYAQLVKDRMVLSAEVMREYDKRFVYKRIFGGRVDRAVQTEQAESLW